MTSPPRVLVAELTHRCPLRCAYCSNPLELVERSRELTTRDWNAVMQEAGAIGVWQAHLTGGEPLLRPDLVAIASAGVEAGLYVTLVTSGVGGRRETVEALVEAGVMAVQVSFQDLVSRGAVAIAGVDHAREKIRFCHWVRRAGASLTVNVVLHRYNIERLPELVRLALALGADRLELANVQLHGWAASNASQLLPTDEQIATADRLVAELELRHAAELDILYVMPDAFTGRAKACMGGWGRRTIVVSPDGCLLPCHEAKTLPLSFDSVRNTSLSRAWNDGEAFRAFRGEAFLEEPCRTRPARERDFGGCRCQALRHLGRATAADPACAQSPGHAGWVALRLDRSAAPLRLRDSRAKSASLDGSGRGAALRAKLGESPAQ